MSDGQSKPGGTPSRQSSSAPQEDAAAAAKIQADADAKAAAEQAEAKAAAAQAAQDEAPAEPEGQDPDNPKISVEDLIASARTATGYGKYVLAGALSKLEGDAFTIQEAKDAAEAFVSQPIDPDVPDNLTEVDPGSGAYTVVEPTSPAEES